MRNKAVIILLVIAFLATALLVTHRSELLASARTVEDLLPLGSTAPPQSIACNSCADCQTKLASGSYITVTLTADIIDHAGSCIGLTLGESDVVFDWDAKHEAITMRSRRSAGGSRARSRPPGNRRSDSGLHPHCGVSVGGVDGPTPTAQVQQTAPAPLHLRGGCDGRGQRR